MILKDEILRIYDIRWIYGELYMKKNIEEIHLSNMFIVLKERYIF